MTDLCRVVAAAVIVGCLSPGAAGAQSAPTAPRQAGEAAGRLAAAGPGAIQGLVADDHGAPLGGVVVSALGTSTVFTVTDAGGHFALRPLAPGIYIVQAHREGFTPSRRRIVEVRPHGSAVFSAMMRRHGPETTANIAGDTIGTGGRVPGTLLAAGLGSLAPADSDADSEEASAAGDATTPPHEHTERAWRLRHLKRSILKDEQTAVAAGADSVSSESEASWLERAIESPVRLASLFADSGVTGQLNLLTSSSFETPEQLFSIDGLSHGVTYVAIGAPAGARGDWAVRGAMTSGDLGSWYLAGSYRTRAHESHAYDAGMSYSMQRYDGVKRAAVVAVSAGSRYAGAVYGFDSWTVSPRVVLEYGARYARYGYLEAASGLFSPRISVTVSPVDYLRVRTAVGRRMVAPGAEEFLPPRAAGLWLPPERTFSPLLLEGALKAERAAHYEVSVERDVAKGSTVGVRTFYQQVDDQMVALFGVRERPTLGHYYVATAGDVTARGWALTFSHSRAGVRGSVDYSQTTAVWQASPESAVVAVWAPSATRREPEKFHDVTTSVETEIPQTATRVFVLYRINSAFARRQDEGAQPGLDGRFDVQVTQALPFLNFTSAQWEVLVAVRNLFRESLADASVYDELLVVRPPKRVVGGLLVRF